MDPILLANLIDRLQALQRLKTDFGLELRAVNLAFLLTHKLLLIISGNSLNHCLKYGVHFKHSVMTAHVELKQDVSVSQLKTLKDELRQGLDEFDFVHTTIEIEFANEDCRDE